MRDQSDSETDDWEEAESSELEEAFVAATTFVAAVAAVGGSMKKVPKEVQLQLYGFYKIATEGTCISPQPSRLKITARAKCLASNVPDIVASKVRRDARHCARHRDDCMPQCGALQVFRSFMHEEESGNELKMDAIHAFAREGEFEKMLKCLEGGVSVNANDSEDRTPLHWSVDRGHFDIVELLVRKNANVNAKRSDW